MTDRWTIIRCHSRRELEAAAWVRKFGASVYVPMYETTVRRAKTLSHRQRSVGIRHTVVRPLYPGYFFALLDAMRRDIHDLPGVLGKLAFADVPCYLPGAVIEDMRALEVGGRLVIARGFECAVAIGDRVMIVDGPFASFAATVDRIIDQALDGDVRISVLAAIFGRATRVELDVGQVQRA